MALIYHSLRFSFFPKKKNVFSYFPLYQIPVFSPWKTSILRRITEHSAAIRDEQEVNCRGNDDEQPAGGIISEVGTSVL